MAIAGEVNQAVGRAYQLAFIAALQGTIPYFDNQFTVDQDPVKTSFVGRSGESFSFDFNGMYLHPWKRCEVFGECKGYKSSSDLLNEFRLFLAKAFVASVDSVRHREDLFWFVTNVSFGCSEREGVRTADFALKTLTDTSNAVIRKIVGNGSIDPVAVERLIRNVGIFIFTDSFLMSAKLSYRVQSGDTLWTIMKRLHGGSAPSGFRAKAEQIAWMNRLDSPDQIKSGKRINLQWYGLDA